MTRHKKDRSPRRLLSRRLAGGRSRVAALNEGFSSARKALIEAKIDKALKNGDIDADEADDLKSELDDADLPGYKTVGGGGFDLGSYAGAGSSEQQRRGLHR
jgi:hypothetical protein